MNSFLRILNEDEEQVVEDVLLSSLPVLLRRQLKHVLFLLKHSVAQISHASFPQHSVSYTVSRMISKQTGHVASLMEKHNASSSVLLKDALAFLVAEFIAPVEARRCGTFKGGSKMPAVTFMFEFDSSIAKITKKTEGTGPTTFATW